MATLGADWRCLIVVLACVPLRGNDADVDHLGLSVTHGIPFGKVCADILPI